MPLTIGAVERRSLVLMMVDERVGTDRAQRPAAILTDSRETGVRRASFDQIAEMKRTPPSDLPALA
jgi:hypothetical protein